MKNIWNNMKQNYKINPRPKKYHCNFGLYECVLNRMHKANLKTE